MGDVHVMLRYVLVLACLGLLCGCEGPPPHPRSQLDQQMFGPVGIRLHPTFTQVEDLSHVGKPDGIEATLEVDDQFDEPTRATGRLMFELYQYRKDSPLVRGTRIGGPWITALDTKSQQQEHWNAALRAYTFQLHYPQIAKNRYYVLTAQMDLNASGSATRPAGRLFDQLIIEPQNEEGVHVRHPSAPSRPPTH